MAWTLPQTIVGCMRKRNKDRLYSCRGIQQKTRKHIKGTSYWRDLEPIQLWRQVSTVSRSLQTHILEKSRLKVKLVWFSLAFWGQCWLWSRRCWSSVFNTAVHEAGQSLTLPALAPVLGSFFSHSHILSPLILQFPWAISTTRPHPPTWRALAILSFGSMLHTGFCCEFIQWQGLLGDCVMSMCVCGRFFHTHFPRQALFFFFLSFFFLYRQDSEGTFLCTLMYTANSDFKSKRVE